MAGRTRYVPIDLGLFKRGRWIKMRREFGNDAKAVGLELYFQARDQGPVRGHDGTFKSSFLTIAEESDVEDDAAESMIRRAAALGILDDLVICSGDDAEVGVFTARISGWKQDIETPLAADRKHGQRSAATESSSGQPETTGDDQEAPESLSPDVPESHGDVDVDVEVKTFGASAPKPPTPVKFDGRVVKPQRLADVSAVLEHFNEKAGTSYGPLTGKGQPSKNLSRILGAFAADDRWTVEIANLAIDQSFAAPFWTETPGTGVVFGDAVREQHLERALSPASRPESTRERFLRASQRAYERNTAEISESPSEHAEIPINAMPLVKVPEGGSVAASRVSVVSDGPGSAA